VAVLAALFAWNFLLTFVPHDLFVERARQAVTSGALTSRSGYPFFSANRPYRYDINDCLILAMLASPQPTSRLEAAVSPAVANFGTLERVPQEFRPIGIDESRAESVELAQRRQMRPGTECFLLKETLSRQPPSSTMYHRYIHGYLTIAATLLIPFNYATATGVE
jgi:hypothetical protein